MPEINKTFPIGHIKWHEIIVTKFRLQIILKEFMKSQPFLLLGSISYAYVANAEEIYIYIYIYIYI